MAGYYDEETGEFIDTGDVGVNQGELDDTSGTADIGDYYDMSEFDAATESYLQSNFPELAGNATLTKQLGGALQKVGASAFDSLKKTFTNKDGSVDWRACYSTPVNTAVFICERLCQ